MSMIRTVNLLVLVAGMATATAAQASVVTHQGNTAPSTEGWVLNGNNPAINLGGTEGGTDFWELKGSGSPASTAFYSYNTSGEDLSAGWTLESTFRSVYSSTAAFGVSVAFEDGQNRWSISLLADSPTAASNGAYYMDSGLNMVQIASFDAHQYRDYRMTYDPTGDSGNGAVTIWIDEDEITTLARSDVYSTTSNRVFWGAATSSGQHGRYNLVDLAVVPEPGSLSLLGLSGLAMLRRRRSA